MPSFEVRSSGSSRALARGRVAARVLRKANKMSKARFSPSNPGPVAHSFARFVSENKGIEISPAEAQALFSYHSEWQNWRNAPGGEAEQEKAARDENRSAQLAVSKAAQIEKARALLIAAGEIPAPKTAKGA